jgi:UDP-N-acetylglucosamine diphosphorylase/glucosamine-1-phosphate N-acetyltransferase
MPQSTIYGSCYIGCNTTIKVGAKIFSKTSIGPWCKVGGENENAIIQSYSNKQHDGYLGHSYLCEWVNIGAGSNTSDLKNTYGNIKVQLREKEINTERMFMGLLCGDHTKSAINTAFTTGTTAGICGILVADGFLPNVIPSFAWRGTKGCSQYKIDKALETAQIVMQRRNKKLLPEEIELIEQEYKIITNLQ